MPIAQVTLWGCPFVDSNSELDLLLLWFLLHCRCICMFYVTFQYAFWHPEQIVDTTFQGYTLWCWNLSVVVQVDDNMVNRRVASSMLQRYGATVVSVNGGVEALAVVRKQEPGEEIDLVLMDIQMPEVGNGLQTNWTNFMVWSNAPNRQLKVAHQFCLLNFTLNSNFKVNLNLKIR